MTAAGERFAGLAVTVAGLGVSGVPAAKVLHSLGARVTVVNGVARGSASSPSGRTRP
ncbi:MAG: hypothetical protein HOW71_09765, partial [Nonomuraea sp.]|nr:hypothetical protein [Nonomuraea sp.]